LLGDKSPSVIFDNSKIKAAVGDFDCPIDPWEGMRIVAERYPPKADGYDAALDLLYDRIIAEQRALGSRSLPMTNPTACRARSRPDQLRLSECAR
jgi:hypothetical protein